MYKLELLEMNESVVVFEVADKDYSYLKSLEYLRLEMLRSRWIELGKPLAIEVEIRAVSE